jgi:hypothetical protein
MQAVTATSAPGFGSGPPALAKGLEALDRQVQRAEQEAALTRLSMQSSRDFATAPARSTIRWERFSFYSDPENPDEEEMVHSLDLNCSPLHRLLGGEHDEDAGSDRRLKYTVLYYRDAEKSTSSVVQLGQSEVSAYSGWSNRRRWSVNSLLRCCWRETDLLMHQTTHHVWYRRVFDERSPDSWQDRTLVMLREVTASARRRASSQEQPPLVATRSASASHSAPRGPPLL